MMIPEDGRAQMMALRDGRSLKRFLDDVWAMRNAGQPGKRKSTGDWPIIKGQSIPSNVTPMRKKK